MNTRTDPAQLYLSLMKKTLCFSLWKDPGKPIETVLYRFPGVLRLPIRLGVGLLRVAHLQLVRHVRYTEQQREDGTFRPSQADTMIGARRLDNLQCCVESVLRDHVAGDLIETGVWRGGACILMRAILAAHGVTDRRVWVADSFAGLPEPDPQKYPADQSDPHYKDSYLAVSQEEVASNFRKYGLLDEQVVFLKGWFKDTLPTAPIEKLAVMRLDGDMYESTMDALNALYAKLSPGGYCIIDDYALPNCRQAVEDFRATHRIKNPLLEIDWSGRYWRKE
jgi:O-methyltransferase